MSIEPVTMTTTPCWEEYWLSTLQISVLPSSKPISATFWRMSCGIRLSVRCKFYSSLIIWRNIANAASSINYYWLWKKFSTNEWWCIEFLFQDAVSLAMDRPLSQFGLFHNLAHINCTHLNESLTMIRLSAPSTLSAFSQYSSRIILPFVHWQSHCWAVRYRCHSQSRSQKSRPT